MKWSSSKELHRSSFIVPDSFAAALAEAVGRRIGVAAAGAGGGLRGRCRAGCQAGERRAAGPAVGAVRRVRAAAAWADDRALRRALPHRGWVRGAARRLSGRGRLPRTAANAEAFARLHVGAAPRAGMHGRGPARRGDAGGGRCLAARTREARYGDGCADGARHRLRRGGGRRRGAWRLVGRQRARCRRRCWLRHGRRFAL